MYLRVFIIRFLCGFSQTVFLTSWKSLDWIVIFIFFVLIYSVNDGLFFLLILPEMPKDGRKGYVKMETGSSQKSRGKLRRELAPDP